MRDKKKTTSEKTPEQEALEKHVDAMMDPKKPDEAVESAPIPAVKKPEPTITAVAIPADDAPKTAPKLGKQISITDASAKPLSIDKLDELTKSITESDTPKKSRKTKAGTEEPDDSETPEESETKESAKAEDEPESAVDITEGESGLDDAETDKAVDDIVAYESDVMLAVADSTAEAHNKEVRQQAAPKKHRALSTIFWTLVTLTVILIAVLIVLLVMGDSLADKLGL